MILYILFTEKKMEQQAQVWNYEVPLTEAEITQPNGQFLQRKFLGSNQKCLKIDSLHTIHRKNGTTSSTLETMKYHKQNQKLNNQMHNFFKRKILGSKQKVCKNWFFTYYSHKKWNKQLKTNYEVPLKEAEKQQLVPSNCSSKKISDNEDVIIENSNKTSRNDSSEETSSRLFLFSFLERAICPMCEFCGLRNNYRKLVLRFRPSSFL